MLWRKRKLLSSSRALLLLPAGTVVGRNFFLQSGHHGKPRPETTVYILSKVYKASEMASGVEIASAAYGSIGSRVPCPSRRLLPECELQLLSRNTIKGGIVHLAMASMVMYWLTGLGNADNPMGPKGYETKAETCFGQWIFSERG
jgi:hypothetical protein